MSGPDSVLIPPKLSGDSEDDELAGVDFIKLFSSHSGKQTLLLSPVNATNDLAYFDSAVTDVESKGL